MNTNWFGPAEWERIQKRIPIICVDILPVRFAHQRKGHPLTLGLIRRDTPHQGQRWCLIGGRVLYGESLGDAIKRQLYGALGDHISFHVAPDEQPLYVAQYLQHPTDFFPFDPRKQAIGLTYYLEIEGEPVAQGEALCFDWFSPHMLPSPAQFGFGQERVVAACLDRLGEASQCRSSADRHCSN